MSLDRVEAHLPQALSPQDNAVLDALNEYYALKGFEYVKPGLVSLPPLPHVQALSRGLIDTIPGVIRRALGGAL
jgi:hypothetical protein